MSIATAETGRTAGTSPRRAALVAGIGYLVIFVLAIFANFVVRTGLVDPDDAAATFTAIAGSETLFRLGLVAFLVVFVVDVPIAWALYVLFRPVHRDVALLGAWMRLVYTVFLGVAVVFFFGVLRLVGASEYLGAFEPAQLQAQVMLQLDAFDATWLIGLVCFGIHLMLLGYLLLRSGWAPRALGMLLPVAGAAYVVDTLAHALLPGYAQYADLFLVMVAVPSVAGELWLTVWLLTRAGKPGRGGAAAAPAAASAQASRAG